MPQFQHAPREDTMTHDQQIAKYGALMLAFALFVVILSGLFLVDWWTP